MTVSTEVATPPQSTKWKLRFLGISRYKIKFDLNSYRRVWVSGLGGFRGCIIFSGNCDCELCELLPAPVRLLCCSVLQCVAVCCSVLQCVAVFCRALWFVCCWGVPCSAGTSRLCGGMSQCVEVCCSVLKCVAVCWSVLQCVEMCCSALKCVAVCWNELRVDTCSGVPCSAGTSKCFDAIASAYTVIYVCWVDMYVGCQINI